MGPAKVWGTPCFPASLRLPTLTRAAAAESPRQESRRYDAGGSFHQNQGPIFGTTTLSLWRKGGMPRLATRTALLGLTQPQHSPDGASTALKGGAAVRQTDASILGVGFFATRFRSGRYNRHLSFHAMRRSGPESTLF